jgi:holo-[acyl-carrier protein] synthase
VRIRCGVDLVEIERVGRAYRRRPQFLLRRLFSPDEQAELSSRNFRDRHLAARFAAKEAVFKVLGVSPGGIAWTEVEILSLSTGEPFVRLGERAKVRAARLGIKEIAVSLSHSREHAVAQAVAVVK